jgi:hypothetical protein
MTKEANAAIQETKFAQQGEMKANGFFGIGILESA